MSTNRYLNAGQPGAGVTVDNMASRVKAYAAIDTTGANTIGSSLNISSVTDIGVGDVTVNLALSFAAANYVPLTSKDYSVSVSSNIARPLRNSVSVLRVQCYENGALQDTPYLGAQFSGTLAGQ